MALACSDFRARFGLIELRDLGFPERRRSGWLLSYAIWASLNDDGLGGVFSAILYLSLFGGLLGGAIARGISLWSGGFRRPVLTSIVLVMAFLAPPGAYFGYIQWGKWVRRPPSEACLSAPYRVALGGTVFRLPAAPLFSVATDRSREIFYFGIDPSLRAFCARALAPARLVRATGIWMSFQNMQQPRGGERLRRFCAQEGSAYWWSSELCRIAAEAPPHRVPELGDYSFPSEIWVVAPSEFDLKRIGVKGLSYAEFLKAVAAKESGGHGSVPVDQVGSFDRHPQDSYSFWLVSRSGTDGMKTPSGDPMTFTCSAPSSLRKLACRTAYELAGGRLVHYSFLAPEVSFDEVARAVDEKVQRILVSLSTES
jgi:hypothetical protein